MSEQKDGDLKNVLDINKRRRGAATAETGEEKKKKPSVMEIIMPYIDSMIGMPLKMFEMPKKYGVIESEEGGQIVVEIGRKDVLKRATLDQIADTLMHFSKHTPDHAVLDPDHARKAARLWRGVSNPISDSLVAPVRELSEEGLTWHRLPFDMQETPTPTFDEMFQRIDNGIAVKQWIGALFDSEADRQHYVWLYGEGGQGKGALGRFLRRTFGPSYAAEEVQGADNRFWTDGLIGKRLVVFADCNETWFPTSSRGKSLTGGDPIRVEEKGGGITTAMMQCFLLFTSNNKPSITGSEADVRRAIIARIGSRCGQAMATGKYDALLWAEAPGFLWECRRLYREMLERSARYDIDSATLEDIVAENESPIEAFFEQHFEAVPDNPMVMERDRPFVSTFDMQAVLKVAGKWNNARLQSPFLKWVERVHGATNKRVKLADGSLARRYVGLRLTKRGQEMVDRCRTWSGSDF